MDYSLDSIYEGLYEHYVNDYIIFEGILRRDYMECIGVLNEDGNKNFLKQLWEKILNALKKFKEKIKEFFTKIKDELYDKKIKKIYIKYIDYYNKENGELDEFTMKNFKPFNLVNKISDLDKTFGQDYIEDMYKNYTDKDIENLKNRINNINDARENIHNKIWIDKEIKYPFKEINGLKNYIKDNIGIIDINGSGVGSKYFIYFIIEREKRYKKYIDERIKKIEKKIKEYESKHDNGNRKILKDFYEKLIEVEQNNLKAVTLLEHLLFNETKILVYEFKNLYREILKLYIAGGKYLKSKIIT